MVRAAAWSRCAFAVVGLSSVIAAGACGKSSSSTGTPVLIVDNAHVMTGASVDDAIVAPGTVTFTGSLHPELLSLNPGDILVGDKSQAPGTQNHTGFLRKVVSVQTSGPALVVNTSVAYLTDVVKQGQFEATIQLPDTVPATTSGLTTASFPSPGLTTKGGGGTSIKLLDYSGTSIFNESGSAVVGTAGHTVAYQMHATVTKGTLDFEPSFDIGADIVPDLLNPIGSIHGAHVIATGTLNADAEFDVGLSVASTVTGDDIAALIASKITKSTSTTLVNYPLVDLGSLSIGPIPLPVSATFTTTLTCQAEFGTALNVTGGATASGTIQAGFTYDGDTGTFTPSFTHNETFMQIGPNWTISGDMYFHCVVEPKVAVNLFDMASGEIWADPYFTVEANADCSSGTLSGDVHGDAYAGVSATAHGKLDVLGLFKWEKECELFDLESDHAPFSGTVSLPPGSTCVPAAPYPSVATHSTPAAACFDGTSSGGDAGTGDETGGGSETGSGETGGEACVPTGEAVPTGWTCDASKWDNCVCDCNCGVADIDCGDGASCGGCTHDTCTTGAALGSTCTKDGQGGACIQAICANDDYCCTSGWTASCVQHIIDGDYGCTKMACASDAGP